METWTTSITGSTSATSVTVNLSATSKFVACVFEYSGVAALGTNSYTTSSSASPSISITTQDANNYCVGGFAGQGTSGITAGSTNLRADNNTIGGGGATNVTGGIVDTTVATAGTCTTSVTDADILWAIGSLELRSTTGGATSIKDMIGRGIIPFPH